ncbi:MAG: hypothetical protein ABJN95_11175 [Maribacter sp.]|uniref:hypothetical protein n=1 Tax=Maribacter sp. TaxID=1897614 RepID=UPI003298CBC7
MTKSDLNTDNILDQLSEKQLDGNVVADILNKPRKFPTELIEKISIETALKYWNGDIDFADGTCIMNNLYFYWQLNPLHFESEGFSKLSMDCYEAFDAGEYRREEDGPEVNLGEKYTKPIIEEILKSINAIK